MRTTTAISSLACGAATVVAFTVLGAGAAHAGEITGNGKSLKQEDGTLHGASICAFSGYNDTFTGDPDVPDEDGFGRTQNWGQVPREVRAVLAGFGLHPGDSCKPGGGGH